MKMRPLCSIVLLLVIFQLSDLISVTSANQPIMQGHGGRHAKGTAGRRSPSSPSQDLVHSSCSHASYPNLCLRTLSSYSPPAQTPSEIAQAAVRVSLARARRVSAFLGQLKSNGGRGEQVALRDCVEQIGDSVDDLSRTLEELKHLGRGSAFKWQMSNAETWVSAALTNEDTCLDGFKEVVGRVRADLKRKIINVARVTSNALYLINRLGQTRQRQGINS